MNWTHPLTNRRVIQRPGAECTPFVFRDRLYRLDNIPSRFEHYPIAKPEYHASGFLNDIIQVRDVAADRVVSTPLKGHYFGMAFVWQDRVYVFAAEHDPDRPFWKMKRLKMTWSDDLLTWSDPECVLEAEPNEHFFNFGVCRADDRFYLLYESDDPQWCIFTFKYCVSDDLRSWSRIENGLYGTDKYVGGPAFYYEGDWFYTLFLHSLGQSRYETRLTRSRDCISWEDAPEDRVFLTFDETHITDPEHFPGVGETNASDAELCYWQGKTLVYFNGGNQGEINQSCDLQLAEFDGTPRELFESFYR